MWVQEAYDKMHLLAFFPHCLRIICIGTKFLFVEVEYMDIIPIISSLRVKRPIFHSEEDFQFALAWEIKQAIPDSQVRLEVPFEIDGERKSVDVVVINNGYYYPIELKYKQDELKDVIYNNEQFNLIEQKRTTDSCPEFIKDIERVEKLSFRLNGGNRLGFAIWLTNEDYYWDTRQLNNTHAPFFVNEGAELKGRLQNAVDRHKAVELSGAYTVHWNEYSDFDTLNGWFRYALIEIK